MLRERIGEHCADSEIGGTQCLGRDCGNTVLRERLGEMCAEREKLGNTVMRERLEEHCPERDIGGTLC